MGVDEHLLKIPSKPSPSAQPIFNRISAVTDKLNAASKGDVSFKELRSEIRRLTGAVNELLQVFSRAHEDIRAEPNAELPKKLDKLIEQNEELGRATLLLLELHREHLPQIAKHTRLSAQLKLRKPAASIYSERIKQ